MSRDVAEDQVQYAAGRMKTRVDQQWFRGQRKTRRAAWMECLVKGSKRFALFARSRFGWGLLRFTGTLDGPAPGSATDTDKKEGGRRRGARSDLFAGDTGTNHLTQHDTPQDDIRWSTVEESPVGLGRRRRRLHTRTCVSAAFRKAEHGG